MSVALGSDPTKAAMQLGKALNDPVKGITALSKAGVSFTKEQKDQIKGLVKHGKTLEAQKIILHELGKEFGGAAAAASTPMDKLRVNLGNVGEAIGGALLPFIDKAASWLGAKLPGAIAVAQKWLGENLPKGINFLKSAFQTVSPYLSQLVSAFQRLAPILMGALRSGLESARSAFQGIAGAVRDNAPQLRALGAVIVTVAGFLLKMLGPALKIVFAALGNQIKMAIRVIGMLTPTFLTLAKYGVMAFRLLLTASIATFKGILAAADAGLGWIPGIGPKIHRARVAFDKFGDATIKNLQAVEAGIAAAQAELNKVHPPPVVKIKANITDLEAKIAAGKRRLASVPPQRRTALKAEIAQYQRDLARAKAALAGIRSKSVVLGVTVKIHGAKAGMFANKQFPAFASGTNSAPRGWRWSVSAAPSSSSSGAARRCRPLAHPAHGPGRRRHPHPRRRDRRHRAGPGSDHLRRPRPAGQPDREKLVTELVQFVDSVSVLPRRSAWT
jgi:hypothetical protein